MRWRRPVTWLREHPHAADTMLMLVVLALALTAGATSARREPAERSIDAWWFVLTTIGLAPIAVRRRWPVPAFLSSVAALLLLLGVGYTDVALGLAAIIGAYTVASRVQRRVAITVLASMVPVLAVFFLLGRLTRDADANLGNLLSTYLMLATAWVIGDNMRRRRQRVRYLEERAERMERERELLARQAVSEERATIARELHDVVAHAVSVMVIQAGAARRVVDKNPAAATEAISAIETTGRQALGELRRLVGVLRAGDGETDLAPTPTIADLGDLVRADPTLPVTLLVQGDPVGLSPTCEVSAYRIVQEALTNVRKHAGPASASVRLRYSPSSLEIEVADDGRGASVALGSGHGLLGMRERASLCGGEVQAGPRPGGGWRVRARLPIDDAPSGIAV